MSELIAPPGLKITAHGAIIVRPLSRDEWTSALRTLRAVKIAYIGITADLVDYGRKEYGDEFVAATLGQLEFDLSDANRATAIGMIPHDYRAEHNLNAEQAFVLSKIADEDERLKWARACKEHSLSASDLARSITWGRVLTPEEIQQLTGQGSGVTTIQGVRFQFERWTRQMKGKEEVLKMKPQDRAGILKVLEPIIELAAELQESL